MHRTPHSALPFRSPGTIPFGRVLLPDSIHSVVVPGPSETSSRPRLRVETLLHRDVELAVRLRELPSDADIGQLVFELHAMVP